MLDTHSIIFYIQRNWKVKPLRKYDFTLRTQSSLTPMLQGIFLLFFLSSLLLDYFILPSSSSETRGEREVGAELQWLGDGDVSD